MSGTLCSFYRDRQEDRERRVALYASSPKTSLITSMAKRAATVAGPAPNSMATSIASITSATVAPSSAAFSMCYCMHDWQLITTAIAVAINSLFFRLIAPSG